jgi:hypothetical protein
MKLPREVKIRIRPGGKVEVETNGFMGESCVNLSKVLEQALAGAAPGDEDRVVRELLPGFYIQDEAQDVDVKDRTA